MNFLPAVENAIVLVAAGGLVGTPVNVTSSSAIVTPGIAIDPANNLYIEGGSCVLMYPYDSTTQTWDALSALNSGPTSATVCGTTGVAPTFYNFGTKTQPWGIAINTSSSSPSLVVGTSPAGASAGGSIVNIPVTGAWASPVAKTPTTIVSGMAGAPISVTQDASGNTYFVEDGDRCPIGRLQDTRRANRVNDGFRTRPNRSFTASSNGSGR